MKKLLWICLALLSTTVQLLAQPAKGLQPTATHSLVLLQLRDISKKPIPKAPVTIKATDNAGTPFTQEGKTDRDGNLELLVPMGRTYWISVGDSLDFNQLTVPNKPYSITKHTVYFQGSINGKPLAVGVPSFNMMPPSDGQAVIDIEFEGLDGKPLVHEVVTLVADGSQKEFRDSTGEDGKLRMKVPIGENYTLNLTYLSNMDHFSFPAHGGSYNVRVRYGYAGKKAIDEARAHRAAEEAAYNAYLKLNREQQLKSRDTEGHKLDFLSTPVGPAPSPFYVGKTNAGFSLNPVGRPSPATTPYFVDGLLITGSGWFSSILAAVKAEDGEPVWSIRLGEGGISNIEGEGDVVVCATESCTLYAIEAKTGKLLWSKWLAGYVLSAPCIANGKIYMSYEDRTARHLLPAVVGSNDFSMACLDLHTGAIQWQQWIKGEVMSSAVVEGNKLYFNTFAGYSYALDAASGKVLVAGQIYATSAPTLIGGQLCMSQRDFNSKGHFERIAMFAPSNLAFLKGTPFQAAPYLDARALQKTRYGVAASSYSLGTGYVTDPLASVQDVGPQQLVGSTSIYTTQGWEGSRPLEFNGKIYFTQGSYLRCRDAKTLAHVWEWLYPTSPNDDGGAQISPPIVVDDKIVVAGMDGAIREFDPATGKIVHNRVTGGNLRQQPIAAIGRYFAPAIDGKMMVVETGDAKVDKWYCWGGNMARTNRPVAATPAIR